MNTTLIAAIVRQTTVLLAQLATGGGRRVTLANTANEVFVSLVRELREQGVSNKGIADMFGLTLRTYHNKVSRLSESRTERGRPLWEALVAFIQDSGSVTRGRILDRFRADDEEIVRGVLREIVDGGLVFRSGRGDGTFYRAARPDEVPAGDTVPEAERLSMLAWVAIKRFGPVTLAALEEIVPADRAALEAAVSRLVEEGRARVQPGDAGPVYSTTHFLIPVGSVAGWEAAVFDHFQALVTTVTTKLRLRDQKAIPEDWVGGSTYGFEVRKDHPLFDEVVGHLRATRERAVALRRRVEEENERHPFPVEETIRVVFYAGQTVQGATE
jgi:hypothetical protein